MKTGDQYQITDNVDDAGNQHEEQRGAAVTQSAEDCGQQVIGDDEEDTAAADPDISCCQTDCFFRCLHQDGDGAGEADHTDEQDAGRIANITIEPPMTGPMRSERFSPR